MREVQDHLTLDHEKQKMNIGDHDEGQRQQDINFVFWPRKINEDQPGKTGDEHCGKIQRCR